MNRRFSFLLTPVFALVLAVIFSVSPLMTPGQRRPQQDDPSSKGNCAACSNRCIRDCQDTANPSACWDACYESSCVAKFGCNNQTNPFPTQ